MITCHLKYVIDPYKTAEFEEYARLWIDKVNRMGGTHHGYFLPGEGASNIAYALFSFPSLAAYEDYRHRLAADPECTAILDMEARNRSIISYERNFMRPVLGA
ncbi:MAG: NIPSNAP family protein [Pseudomonadota bacterium]